MKKFVICIPTYNRSAMIEEMLIRNIDIYNDNNVDIHIYDSSDNDETKEIVAPYLLKYNNLCYIRISSEIHSNIKVLDIFKRYTSDIEYEYMWICPDYSHLTAYGLKVVLDACKGKYDVCIVNYRDVEKIGNKDYTDINEFFYDCAWHMTSYMATMIRCEAFSDFDWSYFMKKYTIPQRINHSHVAYIFENIALWDSFYGRHISLKPEEFSVSTYRNESYWRKDTFIVWANYWPCTIRALPEVYIDKNKIIKKNGVNTRLFDIPNLIDLRRDNIYNIDVYNEYKYEWKDLSKLPRIILWLIAIMKLPIEKREYPYRTLKAKILDIKIKRFARKYKCIYIYGCGGQARYVSKLLDYNGIHYDGYLVSDIAHEKKEFNSHKVLEYSDTLMKDKRVGIILALNKKNAADVLQKNGWNLKKERILFGWS